MEIETSLEAIQHELSKYSDQQKNSKIYEEKLLQIVYFQGKVSEENLRVKENSLNKLGELFVQQKNAQKIQKLIENSKEIFHNFPKAKTAKIIKNLIELVGKIENTQEIQINLCNYLIEWCKQEKRTYLRNRIEIKLASLLWNQAKFHESLAIIDTLLKEVRKADDKHLLVEISLVESKIYHSLENYAKAKASLTVARACANSIYCPPLLQADIDLMTGILHCQDQDYKTAYSYFYESFEALNQSEDPKSLQSFKYLILSKIMTNSQDEVYALLNGKHGLKYQGRDLQAMRAITQSHSEKSLKTFKKVLEDFQQEIVGDNIIKHHINQLYENLLEQNLFRVIEPYQRVEIQYIAQQMELTFEFIQNKLSELILDKKIEGTLDQGNGCLIIFDDIKQDKLYENALGTITNMNLVVDKLFEKSKQIKH